MNTWCLRPLGDQAIVAYLGSEEAGLALAEAVRLANDPWLIDVVPAYSSVGVFFDLNRIDGHGVSDRLEQITRTSTSGLKGKTYWIPCCYEFGPDLQRIADHTGLPADEVIRLHASTPYTVYAIGFCPGFPYLGYLPPEITGVPRLPTPRLRVEPGSVGLTGRQTGIYPEARPGGWNLLGQTPLELVNVAEGYFPLRAGDHVQFQRIDGLEFRKLRGQRLAARGH